MGENVLKFGTYVRVGNAAEAYELLQKNRNNKIAGGGIWMRLGSRRVATAIDLSACGLDQIEETETEFRIGAMCTLRQLERHVELNALVNHVFEFAVHDIVGVQLRNTATVGGSIYGRFGFSDVLTLFMAMDCSVELYKGGIISLQEYAERPYDRDILVRLIVKKEEAEFSISPCATARLISRCLPALPPVWKTAAIALRSVRGRSRLCCLSCRQRRVFLRRNWRRTLPMK